MSMLQVVHLLLQFAPFTDSVRYNLQLVKRTELVANLHRIDPTVRRRHLIFVQHLKPVRNGEMNWKSSLLTMCDRLFETTSNDDTTRTHLHAHTHSCTRTHILSLSSLTPLLTKTLTHTFTSDRWTETF